MGKINKKSIGITYLNSDIENFIRGKDKLKLVNKIKYRYDIGLQRGFIRVQDKILDYYIEEKGNFINIIIQNLYDVY